MLNKENSFDLNLKINLPAGRKYAFAFIILFISLIVIYGNSFHDSWQYDDYPGIVRNQNIHIKTLSLDNILQACHGIYRNKNRIVRPLSYLSFAMNYYLSGTNVFGYHVVNFAIHYFTSIFLFLLIYNTLQLPLLKDTFITTKYVITLLSVFLWATNPIQVTAVTYIVQRMTSMAAMFYIIAIYFYLKARTTKVKNKRILTYFLCLITSILSFASKENTAMLPVSFFLYDLFFIQGFNLKNFKKNLKIIIFPLIILLILGNFYADLSSVFHDYKFRPFTMGERILTEPRVIVYYISLILYPINSRLTLLHDFNISHSLFTPWTTFPAILFILSTIIISLRMGRKNPLIAFSILFFFLNHVIEGSILPLELIYEHANYLPSMFIYLPISILLINILDYFSYKKSIQLIISFGVIVLMATQGHTTYLRNRIFKDGITLWSDNIKKAPELHRPHHNLGDELLSAGFYEEGVLELKKSLTKKAGARKHQKLNTHYRLGSYYLFVTKEYDKALDQFYKTLRYTPRHPDALNNIAIIMCNKHDLDKAEKFVKAAIAIRPDSKEFHSTQSLILLKQGHPDQAIKEAIKGKKFNKNYLIAEAYRMKGYLKTSAFFFKTHLKEFPDQFPVNLALIEIYYLLKDKTSLQQRVFHLMGLLKKNTLPDIIIKYNKELNCTDYARIKNIIMGINGVLNYQIKDLEHLMKNDGLSKKRSAS